MHPDPHALKIYVDGSALKNPGGPGGLAGIAEFPEHMNRPNEVLFEEGYKETTNNRMELRACIRALEYVRRNTPRAGVSRVIIITDSLYLHNYLRSAPYWKKQKWLSLDGRPIENSDLWDEIISLRPKIRMSNEIQWSKGKTSPILKEVDKRAKAAADRPLEIDRGFRGGKVARSKSKSKRASTLFPAQGQEAIINIYRKRLPGKTEDKIYFDLFSEEQQEFSTKHHAFTTAGIAMDLHRGNCYRVRFNTDPKHPVIEAMLARVDITKPQQP